MTQVQKNFWGKVLINSARTISTIGIIFICWISNETYLFVKNTNTHFSGIDSNIGEVRQATANAIIQASQAFNQSNINQTEIADMKLHIAFYTKP